MKATWLLVLALACGGSSPALVDAPAATCSSIFGQDCGPTLSVALRYVIDGGEVDAADAGCTAPVVCNVVKTMPAAQYYGAVEVVGSPLQGCTFTDLSATDRLVDCTNDTAGHGACFFVPGPPSSGCFCGLVPRVAYTKACDWSPPPLVP